MGTCQSAPCVPRRKSPPPKTERLWQPEPPPGYSYERIDGGTWPAEEEPDGIEPVIVIPSPKTGSETGLSSSSRSVSCPWRKTPPAGCQRKDAPPRGFRREKSSQGFVRGKTPPAGSQRENTHPPRGFHGEKASEGSRREPPPWGFRRENTSEGSRRAPPPWGFRRENTSEGSRREPPPWGFHRENSSEGSRREDRPSVGSQREKASEGFHRESNPSAGSRRDNPSPVGVQRENTSEGFRTEKSRPSFGPHRENPFPAGFEREKASLARLSVTAPDHHREPVTERAIICRPKSPPKQQLCPASAKPEPISNVSTLANLRPVLELCGPPGPPHGSALAKYNSSAIVGHGHGYIASPCPSESRWAMFEDPRIVFRNSSGFPVSIWVMQEDASRTLEVETRVARSIGGSLNVGVNLASAGVHAQRQVVERTLQAEGVCFLVVDSRIAPRASMSHTAAYFPRNCANLRVLLYFQDDDGEWKLFKNQVYSIGRSKKIYTLTAVNSRISMYASR